MLVLAFALHKFPGMLLQFRADGRVVRQELAQVGMVVQVIGLVNEFGLFHQIVSNIGVGIQKPVEAREFAAAARAGVKVPPVNL